VGPGNTYPFRVRFDSFAKAGAWCWGRAVVLENELEESLSPDWSIAVITVLLLAFGCRQSTGSSPHHVALMPPPTALLDFLPDDVCPFFPQAAALRPDNCHSPTMMEIGTRRYGTWQP
jgi:hypothetical protein